MGGPSSGRQHLRRTVAAGVCGVRLAASRALGAGLVGHRLDGLDNPDGPGRQAVAVTGGRDSRRAMASRTRPIAVSMALALFSDSAHSSSGSESCTIPPPACTFATPSAMTHVRMVMALSMRRPPAAR